MPWTPRWLSRPLGCGWVSGTVAVFPGGIRGGTRLVCPHIPPLALACASRAEDSWRCARSSRQQTNWAAELSKKVPIPVASISHGVSPTRNTKRLTLSDEATLRFDVMVTQTLAGHLCKARKCTHSLTLACSTRTSRLRVAAAGVTDGAGGQRAVTKTARSDAKQANSHQRQQERPGPCCLPSSCRKASGPFSPAAGVSQPSMSLLLTVGRGLLLCFSPVQVLFVLRWGA